MAVVVDVVEHVVPRNRIDLDAFDVVSGDAGLFVRPRGRLIEEHRISVLRRRIRDDIVVLDEEVSQFDTVNPDVNGSRVVVGLVVVQNVVVSDLEVVDGDRCLDVNCLIVVPLDLVVLNADQ